MEPEFALKVVSLFRLLAFMVFVYLAFGLLVERVSKRPDSQLKAFARTVCSPVTRPVARFLGPGAPYKKVLLNSMGVVAVIWAIAIVLHRALTPR